MSKKEDFELNKAIATALGFELYKNQFGIPAVGYYDNEFGYLSDYCNDWNDLMPLVIEHKIFYKTNPLNYTSTCVMSNNSNTSCFSVVEVTHKNLQISLAECLLEVLTS